MSIYLILGCFGLKNGDFISCNGIENIIFHLNKNNENYAKISNFFDKYKLFDNPIMDYNAIKNFLFSFKENFNSIFNRVWEESVNSLIGKFIHTHKECGLYLKLSIHNEQNSFEEKSILIKSSSSANKTLTSLDKKKILQRFKK